MAVSNAATVTAYLDALDPARRAEIEIVRDLVNARLPAGFVEAMDHGMIGWVVPLADYPDTYNKQPLVYAALAAQKDSNSLYLNCVHASPERSERLRAAWAASGRKLDMGKSCIRFRRAADLAPDVIGAEIAATTPGQFIVQYEASRPPR